MMIDPDYQAALLALESVRSRTVTTFWLSFATRRLFKSYAGRCRRAATTLDRIRPPLSVAREHAALADAMRDLASAFDRIAARGDIRGFDRFRLLRDAPEVESAKA